MTITTSELPEPPLSRPLFVILVGAGYVSVVFGFLFMFNVFHL
jgi:hypothetical protein